MSLTDIILWPALAALLWLTRRQALVKPLAALGSIAYPEQDYEQEYSYIAYGSDRSGERGVTVDDASRIAWKWPRTLRRSGRGPLHRGERAVRLRRRDASLRPHGR